MSVVYDRSIVMDSTATVTSPYTSGSDTFTS
jgi:hypothetical protein